MPYTPQEILETISMIENYHFDIRTVTLGINILDCAGPDPKAVSEKIAAKILRLAGKLVATTKLMEQTYGVPIINKRIAVTPISLVAQALAVEDYLDLALMLDQTAASLGVDFLGGFSALVHKGETTGAAKLIAAIPRALASTNRVCSSVNLATTKAGINMDAVLRMAQVIKETAELTKAQNGIGCAKLVVFANAPEDNPFMAGAFHGIGEPEAVINIGISGPGVVKAAVERLPDCDFRTLAEEIKRVAFKITRVGELIGRKVSQELQIPFGIVDLSLAPTPAVGDSVANILEAMGLESCGGPGTTAALAILNDAVKKGGAMASSAIGGLSGAFIPVSEDAGMIAAVEAGSLSIEKLEAMTSVCSVGLDMIAVPGDTTAELIAGIIADEMAIGVINNKTTAVRIIPVPGKSLGEKVEFGGLLGTAPIMPVRNFSPAKFIHRGGHIPAPFQALTN
ncbi:MAG TPA: PFL family protein [Bacillota bacterium]|nr:PFL family protein [Bacillota bacterium]